MSQETTLIEIAEVERVMRAVFEVVKEEEIITTVAALLSMIIMSANPTLEGEDLVTAVETASQAVTRIASEQQSSVTLN